MTVVIRPFRHFIGFKERFLRWLAPDWIGDKINRTALVEQKLWDVANGKRDLPTKEECKEWALKIGVPSQLSK